MLDKASIGIFLILSISAVIAFLQTPVKDFFNDRIMLVNIQNNGFVIKYEPQDFAVVLYSVFSLTVLRHYFKEKFGLVFMFIYPLSEAIGNTCYFFWNFSIMISMLNRAGIVVLLAYPLVALIFAFVLRKELQFNRTKWYYMLPFIGWLIYVILSGHASAINGAVYITSQSNLISGFITTLLYILMSAFIWRSKICKVIQNDH